jgi:predicted nicotinamide N-methyase
VNDQELEERIAAFPSWHYMFEFEGGVRTPVPWPGQINRHRQRRRYFFDALLALMGGTLGGHRVLDLGCNAGLWSLSAIESGADFVLGIDANQMYIDQAGLVFEAKGVEHSRYSFVRGNIFEQRFDGQFDVVLCLGIMEVSAKPVELFELMCGAGAKVIVIDTGISRARSSFFEVAKLHEPRNRVDHELVLMPSFQAVIELAAEFGLQAVPLAHNMTDYTGMDDYREERRMAFMCAADGGSLAGLERARAPRPPALRWLEQQTSARRGGRHRG